MRRLLAVLTALGLCVAIPVALWGLWLEPSSLRVRVYRLELPGWTPDLAGLRVALLADLHIGSPFNDLERLRDVVTRTNAERPDLILIPGDLVVGRMPGRRPVAPEDWSPVLAELSAPLGVHVVLGNQDWASGGGPIQQALQMAGHGVLFDDATKLDRGIWLVGISDLWRGSHDVARALSRVTDDAPILAMTHNPDLFPEIPERVSLVVAGHTHGGQVWLPLIGPLIAPSPRFGRSYAAGHVVESGRHLFVHTGVGTSLLPVRIGVPPEIAILELFPLARTDDDSRSGPVR